MWVICSSGMPSSRMDLACWLKTNWLAAAYPALIWPSSRNLGSRVRSGDWYSPNPLTQWSRMSGLLANTVPQSPVVPSQRRGSATGSRPSKSHSYMVVTMGAVASSLGTWRRRGMFWIGRDLSIGARTGSDPGRPGGGGGQLGLGGQVDVLGLRRSLGRRVGDVGRGERAHPAGELEQDPVRILEVDAAHEDALVQLIADAPFGVVVIGDFGAGNASGDEAVAVLLDLFRRHVEGDMVHRTDGAREVSLIGPGRRRADARHTIGRVGEPEEGQAVSATAVEEEVLSHAGRQLDRLDQWHAEDVRVEVDRSLHVAAHESEMVDTPQLEAAPVPARVLRHVA